ncbi:MAG: hypothetical protein IJT44_00155 [Clostridia bacterium]|nr:hypothetical protein [Clostridia bacterium]
MIKIKDKVYSGSILLDADYRLIVSVCTTDRFEEVAESICDVTCVTEVFSDGTETTHVVTAPICAKIISTYVYSLEFSTKPSETQELENRIAEQNEIIESLSSDLDAMLIAMLEVNAS